MVDRSASRVVEPADLFRLRFLQSARLSPDGRRVAYAVSQVDPATDRENCAIWMQDLDSEVARRLTDGTARDWNPQWSPDGKRIAFLSTRGGPPQIYIVPVDGGEARALTTMKQGVGGGPFWSPDGTRFAFSAGPSERRDPSKPYRITRCIYRFDGFGYIDDVLQDIYVVSSEGGDPERLTSGGPQKSLLGWLPNGRELLYTASLFPDSYSLDRSFWVLQPGQEPRKIATSSGVIFTSAAWTPDGEQILYTSTRPGVPFGGKTDLWVASVRGGEPECRTDGLEHSVGIGLQTDMASPAVAVNLLVRPDSRSALVPLHIGGTIQIYEVALRGPQLWEPVVAGDRAPSVQDAAGERLLLSVTDFGLPPELVACNRDGSDERRITHLNDDFLSRLQLGSPERLLFTSTDGVQVEGWIVKPPTGRPPYPTVLYAHGGPYAAFGHGFHFETEMLCGAGYAVLLINHRGASGYGEAFSLRIKRDWGVMDYQDLMAGVDHTIAKGLVDPSRIGVCGMSAGGFMACWIVGQTDRFKAAVSENPITNWESLFGVSDIGVWNATGELGGQWHEAADLYVRCSPITYAHRCRTPMLMVQGEMDLRCPPEQTEQFYAVLKANGCTVEMLRLPNSSHGGSRVGPLPVRRAQDEALLGWMNRYVLGTADESG